MTPPTIYHHHIRALVGLGNPGKKYERTYHNVGLLMLDFIGKRESGIRVSLDAKKNSRYILIRLGTFMNASGGHVKQELALRKISFLETLVIHDDSDMPLGTYKFSFGRGSAGHKGVQSIIDQLGTKNFFRLRIGIRTKPGKADLFVLRPISKHNQETLYGVFNEAMLKLIENERP